MLLLDNVLLILILSLVLFVLFTFLNILAFSKGMLTATLLTYNFLKLFFIMPFVAINTLYKEREKLSAQVVKDEELTDEQKEKIIYTLQKKSRLFLSFYKAGEFSYTSLMISLRNWYRNKPFVVKIRFEFKHIHRNYESKYINDLKRDIKSGNAILKTL